MAEWGISENATKKERIKSEMADYLKGLNSCGEISYKVYSELFDFSMDLLEEMHEIDSGIRNENTKEIERSLQSEINKLSNVFEKSFINDCDEIILVPKINEYVDLKGLNTVTELKCRFISSVSRATIKGVSEYWQRYTRERFNEYLCTEFDKEELEVVYAKLGNGCNKELCVKFVELGCKIDLLDIEL